MVRVNIYVLKKREPVRTLGRHTILEYFIKVCPDGISARVCNYQKSNE